jgi:anti-sigma B factor antagonist
MEKLQVKTEFLDKDLPVVCVELGGYIDQSNSDKLQKVLDNLFKSQHFNLIFDFSKVIYMSSAGWGIFVGDVKRVRENGGDIKISNMNAEIYEVYQMLEFYHILEDFNTTEEALEAFGVTLEKQPEPIENEPPQHVEEPEPTTFFEKGNELYNRTQIIIKDDKREINLTQEPLPVKEVVKKLPGDNHEHHKKKIEPTELNITFLPVHEKIRKVVAQFPLLSTRQIKKMLRHDEFGQERIGYFRFYQLLRELNLETKAKRYRYYRSC